MSITNWKEREKKQRRNDILGAAEKLFFKKGYDNVSMNDIAKEVGLGKSTLYIYFDNKEEIFFAIVLRGVTILKAMIKEEVEKNDSGLEKLAAFKKAYNEFISNYSDHFKAYNYFQSERFNLADIINEGNTEEVRRQAMLYSVRTLVNILPDFSILNVSEYVKDIFKLHGEIFFILYDSIKMGIEEGTIKSNVDPLKITIIQILISENMGNMPIDLKMIIKNQKINYDEFVMDLDNFINQLYIRK